MLFFAYLGYCCGLSLVAVGFYTAIKSPLEGIFLMGLGGLTLYLLAPAVFQHKDKLKEISVIYGKRIKRKVRKIQAKRRG